jgi:hypothetical protein
MRVSVLLNSVTITPDLRRNAPRPEEKAHDAMYIAAIAMDDVDGIIWLELNGVLISRGDESKSPQLWHSPHSWP